MGNGRFHTLIILQPSPNIKGNLTNEYQGEKGDEPADADKVT